MLNRVIRLSYPSLRIANSTRLITSKAFLIQRNKLTSSRFQSTVSKEQASSEEYNTEVKDLSDEEVDAFLQSIEELRAEFRKNGYTPSSSLAPPGQPMINLEKEKVKILNPEFKPSEEQLQEWESLKGKPLPPRKDPILEQVTNMIMKDGKKQVAERTISRALYLVYCQTRKDPIELLKKTLDDVAPLMVTKTFNTGVAKALQVPVPLNQRQRIRMAWKWITEGSNQRASSDFAVRLGEEIVAVSKGLGSALDKRDQIHKTAIAHRSYIKLK